MSRIQRNLVWNCRNAAACRFALPCSSARGDSCSNTFERLGLPCSRLLAATLVAALVAFLLFPVLPAQVITGQLTGRITDTSGAVVPGVQVTVKQTNTGVTRTVETNNEGYYTATLLPPGVYEILTQKSDFKAVKITGINIRVNQVNRIDVTLEVGAVAEAINVVADAVALERETGSLSTGVGGISLENLPLNTRDVFRLAFLSPGTVPMPAYGDNYVGTARILINGGRPMSNDYSIDGITSTMPGALPEQFVTVYPSPGAELALLSARQLSSVTSQLRK